MILRWKLKLKVLQEEEDISNDDASDPTETHVPILTDASTQTPFFPTFLPLSPSVGTPQDIDTSQPTLSIDQKSFDEEQDRIEVQKKTETFDKDEDSNRSQLINDSTQDRLISSGRSSSKHRSDNDKVSEVPERPSRPFARRNRLPFSKSRDISLTQRKPISQTEVPSLTPKPKSFFELREPEQLASPVQSSKEVSTKRLIQNSVTRNSVQHVKPLPADISSTTDFEYEYYYEYLDNEDDIPNTDYELVPLANKVRIQSDGLPHCLDVGVFPHPFSCKKFVNCFRNPGTGIVGSIYQCPSYLAFDPVGGRCNWVNEIVCASKK